MANYQSQHTGTELDSGIAKSLNLGIFQIGRDGLVPNPSDQEVVDEKFLKADGT